MAGLLDDVGSWLYDKDENQETAPERLQPLWGGLIKAGLLSVAGGGNLMPEQRAQYIAKAGEALGDIPGGILARKSELAKQKLSTLQGEHMKSQIESEKQKREQEAKFRAYADSPEFLQSIQHLSPAEQAIIRGEALQGKYDAAAKFMDPKRNQPHVNGDGTITMPDGSVVWVHPTTGETQVLMGPGGRPVARGPAPAPAAPSATPPVETPPVETPPVVTPPVVTPPSVVAAPPPVMPPVGGPPVPPYQQPYTGLRNDPIAPGVLPQFQGGAAQGPGGAPPPGSLALPGFQVPGLGMSNPPPPPPPSLAPPPVPPPVAPPPSAPAPGPVPVPPTAGVPPPVVQGSNDGPVVPQQAPPAAVFNSNGELIATRPGYRPPELTKTLGYNEDVLKNVHPAIANQVRAIASYQEAPPNVSVRGGSQARVNSQVMNYVRDYTNGSYDKNKFTTRAPIIKEFSQAGTTGRNMTAIDTVHSHLGGLYDAVQAMGGDTGSAGVNRLVQAIAKQFGNDKIVDVNIAKQAVAEELSRAFKGANVSDSDVAQWKSLLDNAQTQGQWQAVLTKGQSMLKGREDAVKHAWERDMGQPYKGDFISPENRAKAEFIKAHPLGAAAQATGGAQAPAGLPPGAVPSGWTPAGKRIYSLPGGGQIVEK